MSGIFALGLAGFFAGGCASLGIGGGFVLLLYLTLIAGTPQLEAQLINLLFFLPIGGFSLGFHLKHGLVEKSVLLPSILGGILGAACGTALAGGLDDRGVSKLFALLILIVGLRELFSSQSPTRTDSGWEEFLLYSREEEGDPKGNCKFYSP